jgi:hypothetical protein
MQGSKTPFRCLKFPCARERISQKTIDNVSTLSQKGPPALTHTVEVKVRGRKHNASNRKPNRCRRCEKIIPETRLKYVESLFDEHFNQNTSWLFYRSDSKHRWCFFA